MRDGEREEARGSGGMLAGVVVFALLFVVGFTTWVFARGAHPPYAEHPVAADLPLEPGDQVFLRIRSTTYTLEILQALPDGKLRTGGRGDRPETHERRALLARRLTPDTRLMAGDLLLVRRAEGWVRAEVVADEHARTRVRLLAGHAASAGEAPTDAPTDTPLDIDIDKGAELALLVRPAYARPDAGP